MLLNSRDTFEMWLAIFCHMEQSSKSSELGKICPKIVGWWAQMELSGHRLRLHAHYHAEGEDQFDQIVTGDKKWVHQFTPKMKSASKQWVVKCGDHPVIVKWKRFPDKVHLTTFWDNQGIPSEKYAPKGGVTTLKEIYFNNLLHFQGAIKKKHPGKMLKKLI